MTERHRNEGPAEVYRQAHENAVLFDPSTRGQIELTGPDARSFLNNLCSNDIKNLAVGSTCEACFCNAQARVLAHGFITCLPGPDEAPTFWIETVPGLETTLLAHLNHFRISEQVEIHNRTSEYAALRLVGPESFSILEHGLAALGIDSAQLDPPVPALVLPGWGHLRRDDTLGLTGYSLIWLRERVTELQGMLTRAGAVAAGPELFDILRIEAGLPEFGKDMDDSNLAPELGRTAQAISYTKGCYLGQEPIVRIRDLGHVNRTLLGLKIAGGGAVAAGSKLFREGKEVGHVTSSVVSPRWGALALAFVRRGTEPGMAVEIETGDGRRTAEVASLPLAGRSV